MNATAARNLENPTEPWPVASKPDTTTRPQPEPQVRKYAVMATGGSEQAPRRAVAPMNKAFIEAIEAALSAVDVTASIFSSLNESALRLTERPVPKDIEPILNRIFSAARDERFEPGMDSQFTKELDRLFLLNPSAVLATLKARLSDDGIVADVPAEMLYWAARQESYLVRSSVIDLMVAGLSHRSPLVRDAAALGIADLGHSGAIALLKRASESEMVAELREDMESLVRSLET